MKHLQTLLLLLAGLLISSHSVAQGSLAALDAKNGFSDTKFGMQSSALRGSHVYRNVGKSIVMYRKTLPPKIGDIQLSYVEYTFIFGKLTTIFFGGDTYNIKAIFKTLKVAYGEPNILSSATSGEWSSKYVHMNYGEEYGRNEAFVVMSVKSHQKLYAQAEAFDESESLKRRLNGL